MSVATDLLDAALARLLEEPIDAAYRANRFIRSAKAFTDAFCIDTRGKQLLQQYGEFIERETDADAYGDIWRTGVRCALKVMLPYSQFPERLGWPRILRRDVERKSIHRLRNVSRKQEWVENLESIRDLITTAIDKDLTHPDAEYDDNLDATDLLQAWADAIDRIILLGRQCHVNGVRYLMLIRNRPGDIHVEWFLRCPDFGPGAGATVQEAAKWRSGTLTTLR